MYSKNDYPRDLIGYGRTPPDPEWPNAAKLAVQFVVNYEEGGESSILDNDPASEKLLSEIVGAEAWPGQRNLNMESLYEYGSRAGFWRPALASIILLLRAAPRMPMPAIAGSSSN